MKFSLFPAVLLSLSLSTIAFAGSATWNLNPTTNNWNTAKNWTPKAVPNGIDDVATFGISNQTDITVSVFETVVNELIFNANASVFTVTNEKSWTISGVGITNNSGTIQNFVSTDHATLLFENQASAGLGTAFTVTGDQGSGGSQHAFMTFTDNSTAGNGSFLVEAGNGGGAGGFIDFIPSSTAGDGTFVINGPSDAGSFGGGIGINGPGLSRDLDPTAGNGTFIVNGGVTGAASGGNISLNWGHGGNAVFTINGGNGQDAPAGTMILEQATPENATIIANGGQSGGKGGDIQFWFSNEPSQVRVELFSNGDLDISRATPPGLTIGSLEGNGNVLLGANNLTVNENGQTTIFSGIIQDGGAFGGNSGSLTKIGTGTLTLTGANTYTGGTSVTQGTLTINNLAGSGTGTGAVVASGGTLAGNGIIASAVTIGGDNTKVAILSPGSRKQATLTLQSSLTFAISSTYNCTYRGNSRKVQFDQVAANGVTINDGSGFNFVGQTQGNLQIGTILTVINNTSAAPITGTFNNLADGAIISANGGKFQASYSGGDGNDLTLTVVP